ncbi:MAG: 23S rRNA (adenine(2503)-C(2))-methyltransferase RlmN [Cyanobacteriota bacterium]|nr:23S rRNA (adenine(2503)-C(2))-methyltransferase RlmN [Cyanobacteriota bacterium]
MVSVTNPPDPQTRIPLLGQSQQALRDWAVAQQQPSYRGQQLYDWIYHKGIHSLDEISVLPKAWRETIADYPVGRSQVVYRSQAADGTLKLLLQLVDEQTIETVGIPTPKRLTVCVSSQVGCPMACDFCATGKMGYRRNLGSHEILDQVLTIQEVFGRRVSHIVFMGMGEPLLNREAVVEAIHSLNRDIGIGQRHITLSTVGVPKQIRHLAEQQLQVTLAVSLHAPSQLLREQLIPSAKHYPLEALLDDCRFYMQTTGRRISFEYTLLHGVNDQPPHARALAELLHQAAQSGFRAHVNLIPYNPISLADYQRPSAAAIHQFVQQLESHQIATTVRQTRGLDQEAACGQLRSLQVASLQTPLHFP